MTVHVLQTLVLYECEKHPREEDWEDSHVGDRISGILMQLISCLQVERKSRLIITERKLYELMLMECNSVTSVSSPISIFHSAALVQTTLPSLTTCN